MKPFLALRMKDQFCYTTSWLYLASLGQRKKRIMDVKIFRTKILIRPVGRSDKTDPKYRTQIFIRLHPVQILRLTFANLEPDEEDATFFPPTHRGTGAVLFGVVCCTTLLGVRGAGVGVGAEYFFGGTILEGDRNVFTGVVCSGVPLKVTKNNNLL
jgi:hypothetical protein